MIWENSGSTTKNIPLFHMREARQSWKWSSLSYMGRRESQKYATVHLSSLLYLPATLWWGFADPASPYHCWKWDVSEDITEFDLQKDKTRRRLVDIEDLCKFSLITKGIKPFMLWPNPLEPWLCPVRALLKWVSISELTEGHLFRSINANDQLSTENKPLVRSNLRLV